MSGTRRIRRSLRCHRDCVFRELLCAFFPWISPPYILMRRPQAAGLCNLLKDYTITKTRMQRKLLILSDPGDGSDHQGRFYMLKAQNTFYKTLFQGLIYRKTPRQPFKSQIFSDRNQFVLIFMINHLLNQGKVWKTEDFTLVLCPFFSNSNGLNQGKVMRFEDFTLAIAHLQEDLLPFK